MDACKRLCEAAVEQMQMPQGWSGREAAERALREVCEPETADPTPDPGYQTASASSPPAPRANAGVRGKLCVRARGPRRLWFSGL